MIKCICCLFNYNNNQTIKNNYIKFRKNFKHSLTTIEIVLHEDLFFIEDSVKILANNHNVLWQKERCFNIILDCLDKKFDKIVWVDTDIIFHNDNWIYETEKQLDNFCFVQPFEQVVEKEGNNKKLNCKSYAKNLYDKFFLDCEIDKDFAIGLSWGLRRDAIEPCGFFDKHILGANDNLQSCYFTGDYHNSYILRLPKELKKDYVEYLSEMKAPNNFSIGYCSGIIEHMYHGDLNKRGYAERELLLLRSNYNPKDLEIDSNGLYKLKNQKLLEEIKIYFKNRSMNTKKRGDENLTSSPL